MWEDLFLTFEVKDICTGNSNSNEQFFNKRSHNVIFQNEVFLMLTYIS